MVSKLEVNIRSLLTNCEELSKDEANFWKLKKFIKSLDTMINELDELSEEITTLSSISDYKDRLSVLKKITNYSGSPTQSNKKKLQSKIKKYEIGDDLVREMNQLQTSKHYSELRKELIDGGDNLRKRNIPSDSNMDQAMKYYSTVQEKITEDMLALTKNLKEQTETANKIIKRDTEVVMKSTQISDSNINALSKETEKLQDHSRKACKCWLWMMIGLVMMVFVFMVMFMKVMKKRAS